ncbi:GNAT family N-acetyltransferase, partial [Micrococcus sp. HSID17227]
MTPHTDAPEGPSLRRLADAAEDRLGEHGLALRDLGVLGPEDPAASHFAAAVERGFYETVPTGAALRQQLEAHAADGRRRLGVYAPGDDP